MNNQRISAIFTIIVGISMLGMWSLLVFTGQVPYLDTPQVEIKLHILTEVLTAVALIFGGVSVLRDWDIQKILHILSHGMLFYAVLNSSGYYIDRGETAMTVMFGVILLGAIVSLRLYTNE